MLEILPNKESSGFNQFLNYLSTYYSWIADPVLCSIKNEYNVMFPTKIEQALTLGEVPQLSSRHVSRTKHVSISIIFLSIMFFMFVHFFVSLFLGKNIERPFKKIKSKSFCCCEWYDWLWKI